MENNKHDFLKNINEKFDGGEYTTFFTLIPDFDSTLCDLQKLSVEDLDFLVDRIGLAQKCYQLFIIVMMKKIKHEYFNINILVYDFYTCDVEDFLLNLEDGLRKKIELIEKADNVSLVRLQKIVDELEAYFLVTKYHNQFLKFHS